MSFRCAVASRFDWVYEDLHGWQGRPRWIVNEALGVVLVLCVEGGLTDAGDLTPLAREHLPSPL
jgi:hypothetical protein